MASYRFFVLCLLLAVLFTLTAERPVCAQVVPGLFVNMIEDILDVNPTTGGIEHYRVSIEKTPLHYLGIGVPLYSGILFENGEDCGNSAHRANRDQYGNLNSNCPSRRFAHIHVYYDYPIHGIDKNGNIRLVTAANVDAYWEVYFNQYYSSRGLGCAYSHGPNPKVNCWGYAFGYGTWVENPYWIYRNDYPFATTLDDNVKPGDVLMQWDQYGNYAHMIVVSEVVPHPEPPPPNGWGWWHPDRKHVPRTLERNRSSGVCEAIYPLSKPPSHEFREKW